MKKYNYYHLFPCLLFVILFCTTNCLEAQQTQTQDSLDTPFRKGRWLTGLSGSISSNTNKETSGDEKTITNEFGLNFSTGNFIKDRWLLGGRINTDRASAAGNVDRTTESLFVGPFVSYYLSENSRGSLFTTLSSGYVRYREETSFNDLTNPIRELSEGGGFGALLGLGYSYVINDQIAFDIGFDLNLFWIGVDQEQQPSGTIGSQNISVSNIAFTFGFNVILDDFFF
ncbi:hypothetical protein [Muriicola sp. Z0-33]|uniref:hypothetical protein n=1 Tax=Muriicola sp. Z0-33 TaxID=2816957 RepID=UPI002236F0AF|nr:hypothetical protein [Muriicola sp. Z0-33]MCW5515691.1 hypothetical protein [Muriicola sp. Z0-33]